MFKVDRKTVNLFYFYGIEFFMLEQLQKYIADNNLFTHTDRLLLAVSGGIDSMTMLHLFTRLNYPVAVAHCNFQLRGNESAGDEYFVKSTVESLKIPFYSVRFETKEYAKQNKLSIQMAARELRYNWFSSLCKAHNFNYICLAHNADDSLETFFINLNRGTGIDGLTGIKPKSDMLVRPLLFASRKEIEHYGKEYHIPFREDSSNATEKYLRNFIRLRLLPMMEEVNPSFRKTLKTTIDNLTSTQALYNLGLNTILDQICQHNGGALKIHIPTLLNYPEVPSILYEILHPFQFNRDTCLEIAQMLHQQSGKTFFSITHRLVKDRDSLIIQPITSKNHSIYYLEKEQIAPSLPFPLKFSWHEQTPAAKIDKSPSIAQIDADLLEWPLILRTWQPGDYFMPLGMNNYKKISDFLIDKKLSIPEKENTWVILSGSKIVWIVGFRIDERFKVTEKTRQILKMEKE